METTDSFGYWVRRHRKALDLTQEELARQVGCAAVTLRKIEADERRPSSQMAERLARCLGLSEVESTWFTALAIGEQAAARLPLVTRPAACRMPGNLPAPVTSFVGRGDDLAAIIACLRGKEARLLTLTGPAGVGKSRLAVEAARHLLSAYRHGVYMAPLAGVFDPGLVPVATASALGVHEAPNRNLVQAVINFLATREMLLIFDNFEHLLPAASFLSSLLAACSDLQILVTSRACLHLYGERVLAVVPLPVPDPSDPQGAADSPSVWLFCERVRAAQPAFRLSPSLTPIIARICHRLDGLPLAIELAAARMKLFSPQDLLERMERRLSLLNEGAVDLPLRLQGMEQAITWSYELLAPEQRALLTRLAVFADSFTLSAAEAVCAFPFATQPAPLGYEGFADLPDTVAGVAALLDQSMLARQGVASSGKGDKYCIRCPVRQFRETVAAEPRFMMLGVIREYALERLRVSGEVAQVEQRHAAYFTAWVEEAAANLQGPDQGIWLARMERETGNLRVALNWLLATGKLEMAARMACALGTLWQRHGYYTEGRRWLEQVLTRMARRSVPDVLRARTLQVAATLAYRQGNCKLAQRELHESRALYRAAGDRPGIARVLFDLGWIALDQAQYEAACRLNQESLEMARQMDDQVASLRALINLGRAHLYLGSQEKARELFREAHELARRLEHIRGVVVSLVALSWIALYQGELADACRLVRESLRLYHFVGEREVLAEGLEILASTAVAAGDARYAAKLSGAAEALWEALHITRLPTPYTTSSHARMIEAVHDRLSDTELAEAWSQGRAMSVDAIIVFALHYKDSATAGQVGGSKAGIGVTLGEQWQVVEGNGDF